MTKRFFCNCVKFNTEKNELSMVKLEIQLPRTSYKKLFNLLFPNCSRISFINEKNMILTKSENDVITNKTISCIIHNNCYPEKYGLIQLYSTYSFDGNIEHIDALYSRKDIEKMLISSTHSIVFTVSFNIKFLQRKLKKLIPDISFIYQN